MTSPRSWTVRLVGFTALAAILIGPPPAVFAQSPSPEPAPASAGGASANSPAYAPEPASPQPYDYAAPGGPVPMQPYPGYPPAPGPGPTTEANATPTPAPAVAETFGKAGQVIFWADCRGGFSHSSDSHNDSGTNLNLAPSLGLFVSRIVMLKARLDLGVSTLNSNSSGSDYMSTSAGVGFGMGFNIPIVRALSLLPGFDLSASYRRSGLTTGNSPQTGSYTLGGSVSMPVLFHVAPHFFLGVSSYVNLSHDRATSSSTKGFTRYSEGVSFLIGGWI